MTGLEQRCRDLIAQDETIIALCAKIDGYDLAARVADYRRQDEQRTERYRAFDADLTRRSQNFIAGLGKS